MTGAFRRRRAAFRNRVFSARDLAAAGLLMLAALFFNNDTILRGLQFLYFSFLVWLSGKRCNILLTLIITPGIVLANLLVPYGKVLFSAGPLDITSGALKAGLHRAFTLEALVMLSRFSIRNDLRLPGFFGGLLAESFRIFSALQERGKTLDRKKYHRWP
jgi:heptaprenyl diphosphate synthase